MIRLPSGASLILDTLWRAGHQAYVVGGCVRDSLLGKEPKDWDLCTSATPQQMQQVFAGWHVVETGLQHGTLTVVVDHVPYEVTTFRVDGAYTDHRHPDDVTFVTDVQEDLARRDFTVNAMAYHPSTGVVDAFGGQEDLKRGIIRCVGDAQTRFEEDALRILRALRFSSVYGFDIDDTTARAAHTLKHTLQGVAAERIQVELTKMLCGQGVGMILRQYADVFAQVVPVVLPMIGFDQKTPWHRYDVWEHTVQVVENAPASPALRWAALLHDSGKPSCFTVDEDVVGHAWGHQERSAEIAGQVMSAMKMDNATRDRVVLLTANHDLDMATDTRLLRHHLHTFGEEALRQLLQLQRADECSKGTLDLQEVNTRFDAIEQALDALLATDPCVTLRQLAVNGGDLMALGIPRGKAIGQTLNALLDAVLDERLPNERSALLAEASALVRHDQQEG